jgi:hypothetical protein
MAKYIPVQAIERLKEQVEYGGGIATQEPAIVSAQADYLVALSSGLTLQEISIRRILPLAVFISNDSEIESFRRLVETIIDDLVPTLDATFISVPLAEAGSIGWRPAIRTNKRYTAKELSEREVTIAQNCDRGIFVAGAKGRELSEYEKAEVEKIEEVSKRNRSLLKSARESLERGEDDLESAQKRFRDDNISGSWYEREAAKTRFELAKSELEVRKAEYEMIKAKYESETAMIETFSKLAQLLLKVAGGCVLIVGSLHIFVPQTPGSGSTDKKIHISTKSASETHAAWTGEIGEVLKKLAEGLNPEKSE